MTQKKQTGALVKSQLVEAVVMPNMSDMVKQIADDMSGAEVGMFKMLRAGIGLTAIKSMNAHGEWEARMLELFPNKSPRTLQTYMQRARPFLADSGFSAEAAWNELKKLDADKTVGMVLMPASQPKQIGAGSEPAKTPDKKKGKAGPAPVTELLMNFIQQGKKAKAKEPVKPLTKTEKLLAAVSNADRIRSIVGDYVDDADYVLLPLADLELLKSALIAAGGKLNDEMRKRESTVQK